MPSPTKKRGAPSAARKIADLRIDFLSPVDRPAQEGAVATLLKRAPDDAKKSATPVIVAKDRSPGVLTSAIDGHTHIVWLHGRIGETTLQLAEGSDRMHDHPWVLNPDGTITVGENDGHTHDVSRESVTAALIELQKRGVTPGDGPIEKEHTMPEPKKTTKSAEELEATVNSLTERLELHGIQASFSTDERAHFATLGETAKREFVAKSADDRSAEIKAVQKAADEADPVVYTSTLDGTKVRKSDGPALLALTKRADDSEKRAQEAEKKAEGIELRKRAETELSHLPGTVESRTAMLKSIESIADPTERAEALKALRAGNDALSKSFKEHGTQDGGPSESTPAGKLESLVKRFAADNKLSEARAYDAVLKTAEGKSLYAEMDQQ